jgi:hypothetical protein
MFTKTEIQDILERAVATYVQAFAGLLAAANVGVDSLADLSTAKTCAVAAFPAALSVLKSALAVKVPFGDKSASLLKVGYEVIKTVEVPAKAPRKKATPKAATATKKAVAK